MTDSVLARPERFFSDRFNVTPSLMEKVLGGALRGRYGDRACAPRAEPLPRSVPLST